MSDSRAPAGERVPYEQALESGRVVLRLSDGAVLELVPVVFDVVKEAKVDADGNPIYGVAAGFAVRLVEKPKPVGEPDR